MKIAIVGCAHGELDTIYFTANKLQNERNIKIDLLICCGDFQATRNESDLRCMAVPEKFYNMGSFYKYVWFLAVFKLIAKLYVDRINFLA